MPLWRSLSRIFKPPKPPKLAEVLVVEPDLLLETNGKTSELILPPEIWAQIIAYIPKKSDLAILCRVCRGFYFEGVRVLYRDMEMPEIMPLHAMLRWCEVVATRPRIGCLVRSVTLDYGPSQVRHWSKEGYRQWIDGLDRAFAGLSNLRELNIGNCVGETPSGDPKRKAEQQQLFSFSFLSSLPHTHLETFRASFQDVLLMLPHLIRQTELTTFHLTGPLSRWNTHHVEEEAAQVADLLSSQMFLPNVRNLKVALWLLPHISSTKVETLELEEEDVRSPAGDDPERAMALSLGRYRDYLVCLTVHRFLHDHHMPLPLYIKLLADSVPMLEELHLLSHSSEAWLDTREPPLSSLITSLSLFKRLKTLSLKPPKNISPDTLYLLFTAGPESSTRRDLLTTLFTLPTLERVCLRYGRYKRWYARTEEVACIGDLVLDSLVWDVNGARRLLFDPDVLFIA